MAQNGLKLFKMEKFSSKTCWDTLYYGNFDVLFWRENCYCSDFLIINYLERTTFATEKTCLKKYWFTLSKDKILFVGESKAKFENACHAKAFSIHVLHMVIVVPVRVLIEASLLSDKQS